MINSRLFEQYGIDTRKNLQVNGYCYRPFDTLLINSKGSCFVCECESWLPASVGNIQVQSIDQILESSTAKQLKESILDRSYRYCNNQHCSYLLDDRQSTCFEKREPTSLIKNIRLAIDNSCNLSCPSCRTKKIFFKAGGEFKRRLSYAKKIIDYIQNQNHLINVHIGSDGDPFASLIYRYFIKNSSSLSNIRYTIQTNGLLLKKMFQKNKTLFDRLDVLNISIDGATKSTYEKLRRGGKFDGIIDNLNFISMLKKDHSFAVRLHFVVQKKNYHEMPAMIKLAEDMQVDRLYFNKITNWNTFNDFNAENIHNAKHPEHNNYKKILEQVKAIIKFKHKDFVHMATIGHRNETI